MFNGLTRISEDLKLHGDLAETWVASADAKTWTFQLRRGVKFHDGSELVADDVVAFFRRLLDPANNAPSRTGYDMIERVEAPDAAARGGMQRSRLAWTSSRARRGLRRRRRCRSIRATAIPTGRATSL